MKSKFYYAVFIACFLVINSFAQKKQNVYFLKDNGKYVTERDSADYTRIVQEPDSGSKLYNVVEYYPNGNPKMIAKSSAVDPIKLEGQTISFYQNKNKKRVANYENGRLSGSVYDYFPNGKIYRVVEHLPGPAPDARNPLVHPEEIVHTVYDSTGVELVKDGNGRYQIYNPDFKTIEEEGDLKGGKRNGTWKGTMSKSKNAYTEDYADGKFLKGTIIDANGSTKNYTVKEALPSFNGGTSAFGRYLSQNIRYPDRAKQNNVQGQVIVSFVIENDGRLTDIKILKNVSYDIDAEAYRVMNESPKWNPGLQHGVPVRVAYTMPINFSLGR